MNLKGKVIVVTGGSGLIGRSLVDKLNQYEALVINLDMADYRSGASHYIHCDVTDQASVQSAIKKILNDFGQIDGLVNNAYPRTEDWGKPFEEISHTSWQRNVDMQLNSTFYITQQVIAQMVKQERGGALVHIGSIYGVVGNDPTLYKGTGISAPAAYSAIKGGLINFTRYLAATFGAKGIRVNCVSPGGIWNHQDPAFVNRYEERVPMGRMGRPEDIAPAICFLLSDAAGYVTGQNLVIDGGWTAI